jgi:hypothetical protein
MKNHIVRLSGMSRELKLFVVASLAMGMAYSIVDATFNNYLNERFGLTGFQRSFLEFPRELPGFLVVFVSASLWFLCSRRQSAVAMILSALGAILIGFASPVYMIMVAWLFIYSAGQHLFIPLSSTIGMELAREGKIGERLGQLNAVRNVAVIAGSLLVMIGFKYMGMTFYHPFALSAVAFASGAVLMFMMKPEQVHKPKEHLKLYKEYRLYYPWRYSTAHESSFMTFGPGIGDGLPSPTLTIATLFMIGRRSVSLPASSGAAIDGLGDRSSCCPSRRCLFCFRLSRLWVFKIPDG